MSNNNNGIELKDIKSVDELKKYLIVKGENHNNYKNYTKYTFAENILKNHAIYLSKGDNWNDVIDKECFNPESSNVVNFGLCLSFSRTENVAMWMLYSGNDGCMIDYSKNIMNEVLNSKVIKLGKFEKDKFKKKITLTKENFSIHIMDIVYYNESRISPDSAYYVKRATDRFQNFNKSILDELPYCKKTFPWSYESECRLIVTINKELIKNKDIDNVEIEFSPNNIKELKKRIYDSPNSENCFYESSVLREKIKWDLCVNCKNKLKN